MNKNANVPTVTNDKFEQKSVKHTFSDTEKLALGGQLAREYASLRGVEAESEAAKSGFKARITASEATIDSLSTSLTNGFEMRVKKCRVVYRPNERKKHYFLEDAKADAKPVAIEEMTTEDFQAELIQAEGRFECRQEIPLFSPMGQDFGTLVVGRSDGKWFTALRVRVGAVSITERLDSEQQACKKRVDAVQTAVNRFSRWTKEHLKDAAKGFEKGISEVLESQKELIE